MATDLLALLCVVMHLQTFVYIVKTASITAAAMWTTQNDTSILTRFWPPVCWNAAHALSMAERGELKIPAGGSPVV